MSRRPGLSRREMLAGGAMVGAGVLGVAVAPRAETAPLPRGALDHLVPRSIGPWHFASIDGIIIPPSDDQQGSVYDEVLVRSYRGADLPDVMLLIAYGSGQHGLSQVHRPEACYPAFGFSMSGKRAVALPVTPKLAVPATFYTASSNERVEQLVYWTRVGTRFPTSWRGQTIDLALSNLRGIAPDGVLTRISVVGNDPAAALPVMTRFHEELMQALPARGRAAILGEA